MTVSRYLVVHLLKKVLASKYGRHVVVVVGQVYELHWNAPPPNPSLVEHMGTVGICPHLPYTVGGITHICFKQWFEITADAHPGVPKDQKFCEKFQSTHCQVDHLAIHI